MTDWTLVWPAIKARTEALDMTLTQFHERVEELDGFSPTKLRSGTPLGSGVKQRRVCKVLRWTPDSLERIANGLEPEEAMDGEDVAPVDTGEARLRRIEEELARVSELVNQLAEVRSPGRPAPEGSAPPPAPPGAGE